jgi:hypothetical protein
MRGDINEAAAALYYSNQKSSSGTLGKFGAPIRFYARNITMPNKNCASCHQDVEPGKPIGVIMLLMKDK